MTPRQCEIAAESYSVCLLAQAGYDVLVQYGANQPHYDLVANKGNKFLPISVKGSQDGSWMLSVRYKTKERTYHEAIEKWLSKKRKDVVFLFVQFIKVSIGEPPRAYLAIPNQIAKHIKTQSNGRGHGALHEDYRRDHPNSMYKDKIPFSWKFSQELIDGIML